MTPAKEQTYFELIIWLPGQGPLRNIIKAESPQQAIAATKSKYRGCRVELAPAVTKPELIRTSTSPTVMERIRYKRLQKLTEKSENVENG